MYGRQILVLHEVMVLLTDSLEKATLSVLTAFVRSTSVGAMVSGNVFSAMKPKCIVSKLITLSLNNTAIGSDAGITF